MNKINPIISWWMTSKLPYQDIFKDSSASDKSKLVSLGHVFSHWVVHPIKRRLAKYYLIFIRTVTKIKVIGITGSAGKTTTKEMLASILKREGNVVYSYKNIDPVYNIPSAILNCRLNTKYLILEMGVEYPGEMDFYLWFVKPDIGVITNIYPTHTEFFNDSNGVFSEKKKLIKNLSENGIAVLNNDDKYLVRLKAELKSKSVFFGSGSEVMASQEKFLKDTGTKFLLIFDQNPKSSISVSIPILGNQFVEDALAASGAAKALNIPLKVIKKGLESYHLPEHRMKILKHKSGAVVIDDTYNNNPHAAKEALRSLSRYSGGKNKIVVFGDMLELGKLDEKYHKKLGKILGTNSLERLICVGKSVKITADEAAKFMGKSFVKYAKNNSQALFFLTPYLKKNNVILIKGSRSLHLDELVDQIMR